MTVKSVVKGIWDSLPSMDTIAGVSDLAGGVLSTGANYAAKSGEGEAQAKGHDYRASLAEENARRADVLYLEKEQQARREGLHDVGVFQMQAELSGLSGASLDMWVGQRYRDAYKGVVNARTTREQTVNRFIKEAGWHRDNKASTEASTNWSKTAIVGDGLFKVWKKAYKHTKGSQPKASLPGGINTKTVAKNT